MLRELPAFWENVKSPGQQSAQVGPSLLLLKCSKVRGERSGEDEMNSVDKRG